MTAAIDYKQLTAYQKKVYDQWIKAGFDPEAQELKDTLGFIKQPKTRIRKAQFERDENVRREAELVALHLERGLVPAIVVCQNCQLKFSTNYRYQRHCSDECLSETLLGYGLKWDPAKSPAERWQTPQVPSVITPPALERLMPVFEHIAAKREGVPGKRPEIKDLDDPFADI